MLRKSGTYFEVDTSNIVAEKFTNFRGSVCTGLTEPINQKGRLLEPINFWAYLSKRNLIFWHIANLKFDIIYLSQEGLEPSNSKSSV